MPRIGLPTALHLLGQASRVLPAVRFARAAERPGDTQQAKLAELLRVNAHTEYGEAHGFSSIRSPAEYARRVPLLTPDAFQPFVEREMRGERNVVTAEPPVYYTRTTGSSGAAKHVPITASYRRDFQKTVYVALAHLWRRFPSAFLGRALYFVGSRRMDVAPDGNDVGTMSGYNFTELPPLLRGIYAWPYELFEIADLRTRSYLSLVLALTSDVSLIAGIFPAPIVYLLRDLEARGDELARDVGRGELSASLVLTPEQRARFAARVKPRADIARKLTRALAGRPDNLVATALPMLRLVYCWTTSTAALYVPELRRRLGPKVAVRDAIYSATEAWATIPMGDETPGGALAIESAFYEFIPEDAFAAGGRDVVGADALEDGKRYAIVVTTAAGLYRYVLGDIVEVQGFYKKTPRLVFARRVGAASNLVGEKLHEVHVTTAVSAALEALGLDATWFALAPRLTGAEPGYTLHLELAPDARPASLESIAARVDAALCANASDYDRLRRGGALAPVDARSVAAGTYHAYRQDKLRGGAAEAQLKTAHLVAEATSLPAPMRADR
jgi:hypothetical protein